MLYTKQILVLFGMLLLLGIITCHRQEAKQEADKIKDESFLFKGEAEKTENTENSIEVKEKAEKQETEQSPNFMGKYITAQLPEGFNIVEKEDGKGTPGQNIGYLKGGVSYKGLTQLTILDPTGLDIVKIMASYDTINPSSITLPAKYSFVKKLSFTADGMRQNNYVVMEWFEGVAPEIVAQLDSILASIKVK
jgi:hypothetical protein